MFETSEPPLQSDTPRARPNQATQLTDTFLNYICGLRVAGKPERGVVAAHALHSFRANRAHCACQPLKKRSRQRVFKQINFAHIFTHILPGLRVGSGDTGSRISVSPE